MLNSVQPNARNDRRSGQEGERERGRHVVAVFFVGQTGGTEVEGNGTATVETNTNFRFDDGWLATVAVDDALTLTGEEDLGIGRQCSHF